MISIVSAGGADGRGRLGLAVKRRDLARRRKALGFTQESLTTTLGVERSTVVRWECGAAEPQPWCRPKLARELRLSLDQLDNLLITDDRAPAGVRRRALSEIDDMNRRELLRQFSMIGTMLALPPVEDTPSRESRPHPPDHGGGFDAATLNDHGVLNSHLWRVFSLTSTKRDVMPLVRRQLDVLANGLREATDSTTRRRLCGLAGDLFQLAGEIFFDGGHHTDAAHCYTLAAGASKQADAFDLWACAMTRHAFIAVYEQQFTKALPMLELAATLAGRGDSELSTRHWVKAVQARTFAGLGELSACQRALDAADQVRELNPSTHNGGWLRFDDSRLAEERGACYATLERPGPAEIALTEALTHARSPRRRAGVLTDLAMIGVQRRDTDHIITFTDAALDTARRTGSGVISHKLQHLRPHLAPLLGNTEINRLDHEITALLEPSPTT